jgi:hypothetical protein
VDHLRRRGEWGEVLLYLERLYQERVQKLVQESDGDTMRTLAAEARMVQMIHTWASRKPEEEVGDGRSNE